MLISTKISSKQSTIIHDHISNSNISNIDRSMGSTIISNKKKYVYNKDTIKKPKLSGGYVWHHPNNNIE
jgi:hypothetical protein